MTQASIVGLLAKALYAFLAAQSGGTSRRFFQLNGFDDAVYAALLDRLRTEGNMLAKQPLWVRTTAPLPGYEDYALEPDKSATWYRNHVPNGYALVLIFNRPTSDAQSLKDVYPITESLLATKGLEYLIGAAFATYQLSPEQMDTVRRFLDRLRPFPQLRDLAEFLCELDVYLHKHPGAQIEMAIAESLPALGFFRCRELAHVLNTTKGDTLLHNVQRAARLGSELLDDRQRDEYLSRLAETEFDDDSAYGGLTAEEKRALLHRFLSEVVADRRLLLDILRLDWREVASVLHKSRRKSRSEQLQSLAVVLQEALAAQRISPEALSKEAQDMLADLSAGKEPEDDDIEIFLANDGDSLPRSIRSQLRRLRGVKKHQTTDFIAGVTFLGIEILTDFRDELPAGSTLSVRWEKRDVEPHETEAVLAFRTLYGGIETEMPGIRWELNDLWKLAGGHETILDSEEAEGEREKIIKTDLSFRVTLTDSQGKTLATAELVWHYRSDSPAAATLSNVRAEAQCLAEQDNGPLFQVIAPRLRIPIYNTCPAPNEVGDLDISRPLSSLGAWYREATDLGTELRQTFQRAARKEVLSLIDAALGSLEEAWAKFVKKASANGLLAADLDALLTAYEGLLTTAAQNLQHGHEVLYGFRWLVQAWMVGPATFDEWAMMPLLHPLKLHWHRARARRFASFLSTLLSDNKATRIVDVRRFRQELTITYSSAGYPALIALPGRDRRSVYFLPVHEIQGYELFRQEGKASLAYGLDPDLVSEDESEEAAKIAATELARVVQDYIETYPFVCDGLEIYLVQCRNGALPGLLAEELDKLIRRRQWSLHLDIVVHSTDRGAPLYQRITEWLKAHEELVVRPDGEFFPPVTLRILECEYDDLFRQLHDTDLVILPDVLAEKGQSVEAEMQSVLPMRGYKDEWPLYRSQQAPFDRSELIRTLFLTPQPQPELLRHFYCIQWAAKECKALPADKMPQFVLRISLLNWEQSLTELHRCFNWVVCYDTTVDRFLLEATFPGTIEVIRYSSGLGAKRRHNLTVSSSHRSQDVVINRLTVNLESLLPGTPDEFRRQVAQRLVEQAKQVSGDIVLRAAGPGAYLNELIGMVVAKHETEQRYLERHPGALTAWIYLDDFVHWFDGRVPDLLFVAIPPGADKELLLHIELLETKCIGESNFALEAVDAQRQVAQGINRLAQAWMPGAGHLDATYWYDQLYRAVAGNLSLEHNQMHLWEAFRHRLPRGDFSLEISGHAWIFCYDSSVGITGLCDEGDASMTAPDVPDIPHRYHHFGRAGLRRLLRSLVEAWELPAPVDTWSATHDSSLVSPVPQPIELPPAAVSTETELQLLSESTLPGNESALPLSPLTEWCEQQARNLARALNNYGIQVYPIQADEADIGPGVVRFKIRLRPGEKLSRIQSIAPDLQRELALMSPPLIDNVRGTNFVGIDLPHPQPATLLLLPELSNLPRPAVSRLPFLVGKTPDGRLIITDLADLPHLLVAGSTGSGKTIFLYSLLLSLIHHHSSNELLMLLVDPKQTDFVYFDDLPHLLGGKVVIDPNDAINWLDHLATDMLNHRSQQLRNARCRDIHDYNARNPEALIAPLVVVIDEYADLVQVLNKSDRQSFEQRLVRLAQRARNVGIHLVIATQRPSADIVTTSLKTNLPARIAFRLPSHHDSMIILDRPGAENLLGRGDMLFANQQYVERVQGFYVSSSDLDQYLQSIVNTSG